MRTGALPRSGSVTLCRSSRIRGRVEVYEQSLGDELSALYRDAQAAFATCTERQFGVLTLDTDSLLHARYMLDELWAHLAGEVALSDHGLRSRSHQAFAYMFAFGDL